MPRRLNITAARNQFLSLPESLAPGEAVEVVRHHQTVLRIIRPPLTGAGKTPFALLDQTLGNLQKPLRHRPPRSLAASYKKHLYGKKA